MCADNVAMREAMGLPRGWFFFEVVPFDISIIVSVSGVWTAISADNLNKATKNELSMLGSVLKQADDSYHIGFLSTGPIQKLETTTYVPTGSWSANEVLSGIGDGWSRVTQPGTARNEAFIRAGGCWISFPDGEFDRRAAQGTATLTRAMVSVRDKVGKHIIEYDDNNVATAVRVGS